MNENMQMSGADIFTLQDIEEAINQTNFSKGVGPDGFDGSVLNDNIVKQAVGKFILDALNSMDIPDYLCEGRLVLLSKKDTDIVTLDNTRPIMVNSHLYKIMEKAIANKLTQMKSPLLKVGAYQ